MLIAHTTYIHTCRIIKRKACNVKMLWMIITIWSWLLMIHKSQLPPPPDLSTMPCLMRSTAISMFSFAYNNKLLCVANKLCSYEYYKNDFMLNDNVTTVLFCCRGKFDNFVGSRKKSSSSNTATKINNGNLNNTIAGFVYLR